MIRVKLAKFKSKKGKTAWTVAIIIKTHGDNPVSSISYQGRYSTRPDAVKRKMEIEQELTNKALSLKK